MVVVSDQNLKSGPSLYRLNDEAKHFKFCREDDYIKLPTAAHKFLSTVLSSLHRHVLLTQTRTRTHKLT